MGKRPVQIIVVIFFCVFLIGGFYSINDKKNYIKPVDNQTYLDKCGACHFAYQPELLPSASWKKILATLDGHFNEIVEVDNDSKKIIADYLESNNAEHSTAKRAIKIMKSLKKESPMRITKIPYIIKKHHNEFSLDILKHKSIGSLSNCSACHTTAENGVYDDRYVEIPE